MKPGTILRYRHPFNKKFIAMVVLDDGDPVSVKAIALAGWKLGDNLRLNIAEVATQMEVAYRPK